MPKKLENKKEVIIKMIKEIDPRFHLGNGTMTPGSSGAIINMVNIT